MEFRGDRIRSPQSKINWRNKMNKLMKYLLMLVLILSFIAPAISVQAALPTDQSWVKYSDNPVLHAGTCGVLQPSRPAVVVEGTNHYKMYFTDHPGNNGAQIYLASTTDGGKTWTCASSNPVLTLGTSGSWDDTRVITPSVLYDGSVYKMWYTGRNSSGVYGIGYATSNDGIAWTKDNRNPVFTAAPAPAWDSDIVREPSVVYFDGMYHLFYAGTDHWPYFKIGHATSPDGIAWTRDSHNPVLTPTANSWDAIEVYGPSVVVNGTVLEMFYSGNSGGAWLTGHARSTDGTNWTKDANAFLSPSGGSAWDKGDSTDYVAALLDGSNWKLFYSGAGGSGYQIGLMTLENMAQLTFNKLSNYVMVGNSVDVYIDISAVSGLYGYQFQVNYDTTKVSATASFVNTFFDNDNDGFAPSNWAAICGNGVCSFAKTEQNPDPAVSGSGTLAKITFSGVAPGDVVLTFSNVILTQLGAVPIPTDTTVGWLHVNGKATVTGTVNLQGRTTPLDMGTVTFFDQYGYTPPLVVNFSASDGTFSATVPVNPNSTTFDVFAAHGLYLSNKYPDLKLSHGGSVSLGTTTLKGGDANNDGTITIGDLSCIGGDFGGAPGACGGSGSSDINNDSIVNILDLVLAGGNYTLSSPQGW
jgi:predicted GH43/DUF377 family glycosyl hydrolase